MASKLQPDADALVSTLTDLVGELPERLNASHVGERVGHLVLIQHALRELGANVAAGLDDAVAVSGRTRMLAYLRVQVGRIVHTDELLIVAGIGDYARRIRELRSSDGWPIMSGSVVRDIREDLARRGIAVGVPSAMAVEEYQLIEDVRDEAAAGRWTAAGELREDRRALSDRIAEYFRVAKGARINAEELRYIADGTSAWTDALAVLADRGWSIGGYNAHVGDLPIGLYTIETIPGD